MRETGTEPSALSTQHPDWSSADYEITAELSSGPLGRIDLASIVRGRDAGRLVRLRRVPHAMAGVLARSVEIGSRIAHARLLKVLGLAVVDGELHVASEFVEGVTLWELSRAAVERKRPLSHAVALRIVSDLLAASVAARRAFRSASGVELGRCLWPDTAWVAAFGEALLTEPGVGATLAQGSEAAEAYLSPEETRGDPGGPASDVFAAGVLLWELFANRTLFGDGEPSSIAERVCSQPIARLGETGNFGQPVLPEIAEIVERALAREPSERYSGPEEMAAQIALLPRHAVASDREVQSALEELVHIEQQRRTASNLGPISGSHEIVWDIPTRSLRVPRALVEDERITLRPSDFKSPGSGAPSDDTVAPATIPAPPAESAPPPAPSRPRSRRVRNVVLVATALALSAVAAYAATHPPKLGALAPERVEHRVAAARAPEPAAAESERLGPARRAPEAVAPSAPERAPEPESSAAPPARSAPYRPRSIGPYRPKGI